MNTHDYRLADLGVEAVSDTLTLAETKRLVDTLTNSLTELEVRH